MHIWLTGSLFWLGAVVMVIGLWLLAFPASFLKTGNLLGRWVSTDSYFETLDRPRYQERAIYKYHKVFGGLIFLGAIYSMVMLIMQVDVTMVIDQFPVIVDGFWSEWFYTVLYYLLLAANGFAVLAGIVVFIRPSLLKDIEAVMNKWIASEQRLRKLDERHEISLAILPGNPRLFGLAVTLAGAYIMLSMGILFL